EDGVADFTRSYPEGYAHSPDALKLDPDLQNGDAGSWKAVGQEVHVVRTRGAAAEVYVRDGSKLKCGGQVWTPMTSVDGAALDGAWTIKGSDSSIEFTKGGKFRDDGILTHAASGEGSRLPPRRGAGMFELRDFTISFLYEDGTRWSTDFSTLGGEAADFSSIVLRQSVFQKR
ncbi:MAG TPA: hypothetical protein VFC86_10760, partial [Planctomycetota bacterium]|nr:hypothetical protein [Planctomycetota bacterium]